MDNVQRLNAHAQDGNIEGLCAVIGVDPHVLEGIDKIPFVETPLHVAASAGQVHFAIEIFSLKPSFGRKLNPNGLSPLHLAVPSGLAEPLTRAQQAETAIRLINIDRELIRVQGRGRMTPLHYAAERNKFDLLAEFLCACPLSIEDLTIRGETALHVAVRNGSFTTSEVILGWHRKIDERFNWTYIPYQFLLRETYKGVLRWKNEDGDTALHIAASTNQPKV
ncbi:ankyrin repeat-containing protein BDA1-like [Cornus florida]|uniref:ankyrin repeat-containing protein BDA1-like n=1 Tax=Cornus florida TaxID=4283 RepID=UPI00289640E0|nr:ankyrin repeat-containing protein BDA1-like [Cornus florida]